MLKRICLGLVGDFDEKMHTHVALQASIDHCRAHLDFDIDSVWVPTNRAEILFGQNRFQGIWIAPGSPYRNDQAVYDAITWARRHDVPIFGTCGGFQYMLVEYARNVLGFLDAVHGETDPYGAQQVITKLSCSLKGRQEDVLIPDQRSWLFRVVGKNQIVGHFYCDYGVNPKDQQALAQAPLVFTAFSKEGEPRALELHGHRFFQGTLFQPSLDSGPETPNPLILDFLNVCAGTQGR